jgi:S1-C subfamily serine protease
MKRLKRHRMPLVLAVAFIVGASYVLLQLRQPKPHVTAPTTRYHGYELNRVAINKAKNFTVLISNEGFAPKYRGTGILIDATHVLTARHMVSTNGNETWIYIFPGRRIVHVKSVFLSMEDDLAILELDEKVEIPSYPIFQDMHYDGEPVTVIGNVLGGMHWYVSYGIISGDWDGYILLDGTMTHGDSGGPWINEQGEVVALSDWQLSDEEPGSVVKGGVSGKKINKFLKSWRSPSPFQLFLGAF